MNSQSHKYSCDKPVYEGQRRPETGMNVFEFQPTSNNWQNYRAAEGAYARHPRLDMRAPDFQVLEPTFLGDGDFHFYFPPPKRFQNLVRPMRNYNNNIEKMDDKSEEAMEEVKGVIRSESFEKSQECSLPIAGNPCQPMDDLTGAKPSQIEKSDLDVLEPAQPRDDISQVSKSTNKKKCNKFMIRRTIFRGMSKYYKNKFAKKSKAWQRKKGKKQRVRPMEEIVEEFVVEEFHYLKAAQFPVDSSELVTPITVILHSHRYKKEEEFAKKLDFSIIRDLLYCYSSEACQRFMDDPHYAFMFRHFYTEDREDFIKFTTKRESKEFKIKLETELEALNKLSMDNGQYYIIQ